MSEQAIAVPEGFESRSPSIAVTEPTTAAAIAREEAELKAAIVLAQRAPRDEARAYASTIRSCRRPTFAEGAFYSFPRSGQTVKGPSVQLAREIARCWGNIRYGVRVVAMDAETVHIRGFAHDVETNTYVEHEDRFAKLVQRKVGGLTKWVPPDERDLRELINRRGAILVRNAILQVVPSDLVEDAIREVEHTIKQAALGEIKQSREETIRRLVVAFDSLGVTVEMLTAYLKHPLETITADEIAELRGVYKSIVDGNSKVSDHFDLNAGQRVPLGANEELNDRLAEAQPQEAVGPSAQPKMPDQRGGKRQAASKPSPQEALLP